MSQQGSGLPDPTWSLGPISIKRTTDVLALVAFVLSIIGLIAQAKDYLRGAHVVQFRPEQITFGSSKAMKVSFQNNDQFLILTSVMSYVNDAPVGFNAAIGREYVRIYVGDRKYQYAAHHILITNSDANGALTVQRKEDVGPFALAAGSAVSREVLFLPRAVRCNADDTDCPGSLSTLKWSDFKEAVKKKPTITVALFADVFGSTTLSTRCRFTFNNNDLVAVEKQDQEWAAPDCQEEKKEGFWKSLFGS